MEKESKIEQIKQGIEQKINRLKNLSHEFIDQEFQDVREHIKAEKDNSEWLKQEKELYQKRELIDEILEIGRKKGVIIKVDPRYQYWSLKREFPGQLGINHLKAVKELADCFIPFKKIKGHLKEIDIQAEEHYLTRGCGGFFNYGDLRAEIPSYITFNNDNPENFYATFVHEAIGHPVGLMIGEVNEKTKKLFRENHQKLLKQKASFRGSFGRAYSEEEMTDFGQFIAEFAKQYCLDGEDLREHIQSLPSEQRKAYQGFYDFFKKTVYDNHEFSDKDIESLNAIAKSIRGEVK